MKPFLYSSVFERFKIPKVVYVGRETKNNKKGDTYFLRSIDDKKIQVFGSKYKYSINSFRNEDGSVITDDISFLESERKSLKTGDLLYHLNDNKHYICYSNSSKILMVKDMENDTMYNISFFYSGNYVISGSYYDSIIREESLEKIIGE